MVYLYSLIAQIFSYNNYAYLGFIENQKRQKQKEVWKKELLIT